MTQNNNTTVDQLWAAAARRFPALSPEEQRAGIALLRELAGGKPVTTAQFARALGISRDTAAALVTDSTLSPYVHLGQGDRVQGFFGLSVSRTAHQITVNGRTLWTWCAYDTLFLPTLLGETAEIETQDPETEREIRLKVSSAGIEGAEPAGIVASIVGPQLWDHTSADLLKATACHLMFFFASRASGETWQARHPAAVLLPLDAAFEFGRCSNAHLFGAELARLNSEAA